MQVYEQVMPEEAKAEQAVRAPRPVGHGYVLTVLQAVICLLVLLAAIFAKLFFPADYEAARAVYDSEATRTIVITDADR